MKKLFLILCYFLPFVAPAQRNVILVIADDMGTDYCGFYENYGDTVNLPNVRRLLAKGVRFTNAMSNPLCSPTRAGIFTGRYSFRTTVGTSIGIDGEASALDTSEVVIPKLLNIYNPNGIAKGHFGKWHLHLDTPATNLLIPNLMGYDYFSGNFRALVYDYYKWKKNTNGVSKTVKNYATTETVNDAVKWISNLPQEKPFFLWLAFNAPHDPWHLPPYNLHSYSNLSGTQLDIAANPKNYYKAALESMDREMGRLFDSLQFYNKFDSTDIIFIGDNGNPREICQNPLDSLKSKGTIYQGGVTVPLIISGPSVVNPGRISQALVNTVDLFATILELFNDTIWQNSIPLNKPVDSKSLLPIIKNTANQIRPWAYTELFNSKSASAGGETVRNETYKYLQFFNGDKKFYNLINDPKENHNLLDTFLTATDISNYISLCNQLASITGNTPDCDALIELTPQVTHVLCKGDSSGTISLSATGGNPSYDFMWADGITNRTRTKLPAGRYPIVTKDIHGQIDLDTVTINEPFALEVNTAFTISNCGGDVFANVNGGVPPYSYLWSNGLTTSVLTNVTPKTYIVTVTDANQCIKKDTIEVINSAILSTPAKTDVVFCFNENSTSATANPTGGSLTYSYLWSNGQTNKTATNLAAGVYVVTVTDGFGCIDTTQFNISSNTQLVIKSSFKKPSCSNNAGSITANISGGKSPYSYLWSTGATTPTKISNLGPGQYTVTITDFFGCTATRTFNVTRSGNIPSKPIAITGPVNISCGDTIVANYSIASVLGALSYNWEVPNNCTILNGQGTLSITVRFLPSFVSNKIKVKATNYCGESAEQELSVSSSPPIPGNITGPVSVCANQQNVSYSVLPVAGATSYLWTKPSGSTIVSGQGTNSILLNFKTNSDNLRVQTINACGTSLNRSIFITINCRENSDGFQFEDLQVFPNPTNDVLNISFNSNSDAAYKLTVSDVLGQIAYTEQGNAKSDFNLTSINLNKLIKGIYFLTFEMGGDKTVMKIAVK